MTLQEQIDAALTEYAEVVKNSQRIKSDVGRCFVLTAATDAANRLLQLAKTIRENVHLKRWMEHGRTPDDVINDMIAWGQPLASYLFKCNLREKITDKIEQAYGINFSGLRLFPQVIDKSDGKLVFVAYNPREFLRVNSDDKVSLLKDGEYKFVSLSEFDANYKS